MKNYTATINSRNRTAFVILLDRSGSMAEQITFNNQRMSKAEALAEITNRLIFELLCRARRSDGVRNYFDVALIGYAGDALQPIVGDSKGFIPITEFEKLAHTVPTRSGFTLPRWVVPSAEGSTPMFEALLEACEMVEEWCARPENGNSYPPTIFNITDGEASDGDHADIAEISERLRSCS
ncbi:MAG: VWA domain-containing protein, partial [Rikenellaceae bacterium]|nr:VWA domain-containing protein [Rikenellaceae bacterium]